MVRPLEIEEILSNVKFLKWPYTYPEPTSMFDNVFSFFLSLTVCLFINFDFHARISRTVTLMSLRYMSRKAFTDHKHFPEKPAKLLFQFLKSNH